MSLPASLELDGYVILKDAVPVSEHIALLRLVEVQTLVDVVHQRSGQPFASRALLLRQPRLREALASSRLDLLAKQALGSCAFPVDAIFFDKHPKANWAVPAHQDRMFPVCESASVKSFRRSGFTYAQPPASTLATMVALRLHFDPANKTSGALAVLPRSHNRGILSDDELKALSPDQFQTCSAAPGDVLLMKPLIVHRSSSVRSNEHRRVLHVVYACGEPEGELRWSSSA